MLSTAIPLALLPLVGRGWGALVSKDDRLCKGFG